MIEKIERNEEIYQKKLAGETYRKLSKDYGLAIETVFRIVKRFKLRKQFKNVPY